MLTTPFKKHHLPSALICYAVSQVISDCSNSQM